MLMWERSYWRMRSATCMEGQNTWRKGTGICFYFSEEVQTCQSCLTGGNRGKILLPEGFEKIMISKVTTHWYKPDFCSVYQYKLSHIAECFRQAISAYLTLIAKINVSWEKICPDNLQALDHCPLPCSLLALFSQNVGFLDSLWIARAWGFAVEYRVFQIMGPVSPSEWGMRNPGKGFRNETRQQESASV